MRIDAFAGAKHVVAGFDQTCVVLTDATVRCMGRDIGGPMVLPTNRTTPTPIAGLDSVEELVIAGMPGDTFACARRTDGTVSCWGANMGGMLGDGTHTDRTTPAIVAGLSGVVQISASVAADHVCARLDDGTVKCWGVDSAGQIGDGTTDIEPKSTPTSVTSLTSVGEIFSSFQFTFAQRTDATLWAWGTSSDGQLGTGLFDGQSSPKPGPAITPRRFAVGMYHACAALDDGSLRCWGNNDNGQIGDGTRTRRESPVITTAKAVVDVWAGTMHTCARLDDGSLWCWGSNFQGQLGAGIPPTDASVLSPLRVVGF
jgi:alpha-tubulin suppressor-like RCC1 family protein